MQHFLSTEFEKELQNILEWWSDFMTDDKDGFHGKAAINNLVDEDAERGLVLYARILYTFSSAALLLKNDDYDALAERAYLYLQNNFYDKEYGGYFWSVNADGLPEQTVKKTYGQAFVVYAFSAYYELKKEEEILEQALNLFEKIESNTKEQDFGGYIEAFGRNWQPIEDIRLSEKDENQPKSMNTHLHVLEAYTALYKSSHDEAVGDSLKTVINIFLDHIICAETGHLHLFFSLDWTVTSRLWSYGHDIETSWLLIKAANALGDQQLIETIYPVSQKILIASLEGIDTDGGMIYELDYENNHHIREKHWWPQAEAMVGCWYAYGRTGDQKYLRFIQNSWNYIQQNLIDHEKGEWYWGRDENDNILHPDEKAGFWKCPYHNGRALMELLYIHSDNINSSLS